MKKLHLNDKVEKNNFLISTFIENSYKSLSEMCISFDVNGTVAAIPFYVDHGFNLAFTIDGLADAHANIAKKFSLDDHLQSDEVLLEGLLGNDAIQYLPKLNVISC